MGCVGCGRKSVVIVSKVELCKACSEMYHKIRRAMTSAFNSKAA
jgi:hypothetical protein